MDAPPQRGQLAAKALGVAARAIEGVAFHAVLRFRLVGVRNGHEVAEGEKPEVPIALPLFAVSLIPLFDCI